jgi:N utilization substance protein B
MTTPEPLDLRDDDLWDAPRPATVVAPATAGRGGRRRGADGRTARRAERIETRGRARALQALYAADLRDITDLRRIALQVWDDLAIDPAERTFASRLVEVVLDRRAEIDGSLGELTTNWRLDRLGAIERSVLRVGAAELLRGETPPRVVLQEAIHLAERYGTARSARFVNGVLDAYARRLGRL